MSSNPYTSYYRNQAGTGIGGFHGVKFQRGHGFFSRLASFAMPLVKQLFPIVGREVLSSSAGLASDVLSGANVKTAAKRRLKRAGSNLLQMAADRIRDGTETDQSGGQLNRRIQSIMKRRKFSGRVRRSTSKAKRRIKKVIFSSLKKRRRRRSGPYQFKLRRKRRRRCRRKVKKRIKRKSSKRGRKRRRRSSNKLKFVDDFLA